MGLAGHTTSIYYLRFRIFWLHFVATCDRLQVLQQNLFFFPSDIIPDDFLKHQMFLLSHSKVLQNALFDIHVILPFIFVRQKFSSPCFYRNLFSGSVVL